MTEMLDAALDYARRGWPVLPLHSITTEGGCTCGASDCHRTAKHPRTKNGLSDATTDEALIRWWWAKWPGANVGIRTGAVSGLIALDIDPRHGGDDSLTEIERQSGALPRTVESLTGGGGRHLLFAHPGNGSVIRPAVALLPGIDLRGDDSYIVAPPSLHASGRAYAWEVSAHPDDVPLAPMPRVLLDLIERSRRHSAEPIGDRIAEGARNPTLMSLGGTMRRRGMVVGEIEAALLAVNAGRCDPPLQDAEVGDIARSAARYEPAPPFGHSAAPESDGARPVHTPESTDSDGARAIVASSVKRERVEYLDAERMVPLRAATVLAGPPGLGKSQWSIRLAARNPGVTLICTAEDSIAAVVRPRLEAAGADLDRVRFVVMRRRGLDEGIDLPDDVAELDRLVQETGATLLIVDPLMAHLPESVNSWRDQSVRRALAPLHRLAEERGCAIVVIVHLNKREGDDPVQRVGGSIGITAAARSVLLLARDPDDPEGEVGTRRVLAHVKNNYGPQQPSRALRIEAFLIDPEGERIETSRLIDEGESPHLGRDLLAAVDRDAGKRGEAVAFLLEELNTGPQPSRTLMLRAGERHISRATLRRAKDELGIVSERLGFGQAGEWTWRLTSSPPIGAHGPVSEMSIYDGSRMDKGVARDREPIDAHRDAQDTYAEDDPMLRAALFRPEGDSHAAPPF